MKRFLTATLAAACLIGVTACGSDDKKLDMPTATNGDSGGGSGSDSGSGNGSGGLTQAECVALLQAMGSAANAVSGQGDAAEWEAMTSALVAAVPDDLKDDAQVFAQAYGQFLAVMAEHEGEDNPMANADVMAALQAISTPEVEAAANNISDYMDATCPNG